LSRADSNPTDSPPSPHNKNGSPGDVVSIETDRLMHSVKPAGFAGLVKQDLEGKRVFAEIFLPFEHSLDLLRGDENNACVSLLEFSE
jgi:hypothetical protein